jgi:flagellar basal-body rod protein FlgB
MISFFNSQTSLAPVGDGLLHTLERAAIFGEKRHDVIVGNVANVDTPTYKTRDLDTKSFQKALEAAIEAKRQPGPPEYFPSHPYLNPKATAINALDNPMLAEPRNITFQDGNNRSIEQEMTELSKNIMRQTFLIQVMTAQYSQMEAVIAERL